ncbi:MAG: SDR family NAD(P)-dependent oxidoreductase [Moraxellaceae bacterium]|jgi:short-subunit dehydrogenase|nr:SDR family NAD(P)-dependent oxidoreductase [Moraxellaceae bacterium]MBP8852336.1 SDR family NAD(P)-dependent oxidoreductase [Moraxellaceae bacterium]MBP9045057.1 SDR family NAD(P)-dependent oxidoreductase [Moraxellaceae bacterium]MBP9730088.1 SDR family NAD(P)-dependent oxidoreductase [Moraxellaceae bacterium]HQV40598.1 SDR family NAD(P)-dependent oxidoreductase [Moraxellaceae bacterium]
MNRQKRLSYFKSKKILITGAGSGIGKATALQLAELGAYLIITDLNPDSLELTAVEARQLGAAGVDTHVVDVSDWDDMQAMAIKVRKQHSALDVLINNAGVGLAGDFLSTTVEDWQWILSINVMGVVHGCKLFAPDMITNGRGHIVNLASVAGYYAAPDMSAYSASKHAVLGMSESLRAEMAEKGVGVSAICPGVVNTGIVASSRMRGATRQAQDKIVAFYNKRNYGPELVAEAILNAIEHNRAVVPVSPEAWVMYGAKRFAPNALDLLSRSPLLRKLRPGS